jgi:hypothetical protein
MLAEPVAPTAVSVRAALGLLAASRRFGLAALTLSARIAPGMPRLPAAHDLVDALLASLGEIAAALRARRDPAALPPLRDLQSQLAAEVKGEAEPFTRAFISETDLMVDSLNAIADVLHRLNAERSPS